MTGCDRILEALRRGPQTAQALYQLHTIAHSRISDLRSKGYVITLTRLGGTGPESYLYTLEAEPSAVESEAGSSRPHARECHSLPVSLSPVPEQLALIPEPVRRFDDRTAA